MGGDTGKNKPAGFNAAVENSHMIKLEIPAAQIRFASDSSILVSWPGPPAIETSFWVFKLFRLLKNAPATLGIENLHPAYCSLLVDFEPRKSPALSLLEFIRQEVQKVGYGSAPAGALVTIPVRYDGPDLAEVARLTRLSVEEVIRLHSEGEYRVAFLGFAPGFPYMLGLREKLICPRKAVPRLKVPAGSVGLAGVQTGIYPAESPGGWQLIGRTTAQLFDPGRKPATLLQPGDRVNFEVLREPTPLAARKSTPRAWQGDPIVEVLQPGFFSTIQDEGRIAQAHLGISPGGAADPLALRLGNEILGNAKGAAALEMTAAGATVLFKKESYVTITGAGCSPQLDARPVKMWTALPVNAGQVLQMGVTQKMRSYLCVRGGLEVENLLGSRATVVNGGWGGFEGRELRAGDILSEGHLVEREPSYRLHSLVLQRMYEEQICLLRVTRGPQWDWFSDVARRAFFENEFAVTNEVNRLGLRIQGHTLEYAASRRESEMISEGVANGAIQVPTSGQPMILFCEQRTTGGYPKIANVISADFYRLGQLRPGDRLRFKEVARDQAWHINRELESTLQTMGFLS